MWRIGSMTSKNETHQRGAISFMFRHCESSISFDSVFLDYSDKLCSARVPRRRPMHDGLTSVPWLCRVPTKRNSVSYKISMLLGGGGGHFTRGPLDFVYIEFSGLPSRDAAGR